MEFANYTFTSYNPSKVFGFLAKINIRLYKTTLEINLMNIFTWV